MNFLNWLKRLCGRVLPAKPRGFVNSRSIVWTYLLTLPSGALVLTNDNHDEIAVIEPKIFALLAPTKEDMKYISEVLGKDISNYKE
jgi:hypothetical protein